MKNELNSFSVLSTTIESFVEDGETYLSKQYQSHVDLDITRENLKQLINQYHQSLSDAGIPVTLVKEAQVSDDNLVYVVPYKGKNLIELGLEPSRVDEFHDKLEKIYEVLKKAYHANVRLDPHVKNFVFENDDVFYVDIYPPYTDQYMEVRLRCAKTAEREVIKQNYIYFAPEHLAAHFCGDLLKIDSKFKDCFKQIYGRVCEHGLFNESYHLFENQAIAIRALEDLRVLRNIYLI